MAATGDEPAPQKVNHRKVPPEWRARFTRLRAETRAHGIPVETLPKLIRLHFLTLSEDTLSRVLKGKRRTSWYANVLEEAVKIIANKVGYGADIDYQQQLLQKIFWGSARYKARGTTQQGPELSPAAAPIEFRRVRFDGGLLRFADGTRELLDIPIDAFPRQATPRVLENPYGWFECVGAAGSGKTVFARQLMEQAISAGHRVFLYQVDSHVSRPAHAPKIPAVSQDEDVLFIVDNSHLLDDRDLLALADAVPSQARALSLSRTHKLNHLRPMQCSLVTLLRDDLRSHLLQSDIVRRNEDPEWESSVGQIMNQVADEGDWEAATAILDHFPKDRRGINQLVGHISEFLEETIRGQLRRDGMSESELLSQIAAFQYIDIYPRELDLNSSEFRHLAKAGWVVKDFEHLMHPRKAERILRALYRLGGETYGTIIGRDIASVLISSRSAKEWLSNRAMQVRRHVRYSNLRDVRDLLLSFYETLSAQNTKHKLSLEELYIDLGSEYRRTGHLERGEAALGEVPIQSRGREWRFECGYISLLRNDPSELEATALTLQQDLTGDHSLSRIKNHALYAKIIARQGFLRDSYVQIGKLYKIARHWDTGDNKRWRVNLAVQLHEVGAALGAHAAISRKDVQKLRDRLVKDLSKDEMLRFDYNDALHSAVLGHPEAAQKMAELRLERMRKEPTDNFEQEATYLAIFGAASEVLGDDTAAETSYRQILNLDPDVDNRRGMAWATARMDRIGNGASAELLINVVRCLYPYRSSVSQ